MLSKFNRHSDPTSILAIAGAVILFASYLTIFLLTTDDGVWGSTISAMNNAVPAIGLAWLTHLVLDRYIWPAHLTIRLAVQLPFSILFALGWYVAILVIRELRGDWLIEGFSIRPFVPIAFAWQMFQGVTFYALAALASLSIYLTRRLQVVAGDGTAKVGAKSHTILIRTGDGTETVAVDSIISISGAGDYSEVRIPGRIIFSTTTLTEFESRLPAEMFFRAHRSHLVNMNAVQRSEPAGNGRTTLHLQDGRSIATSRAGTRLLREAAF